MEIHGWFAMHDEDLVDVISLCLLTDELSDYLMVLMEYECCLQKSIVYIHTRRVRLLGYSPVNIFPH